MRLTLALVLLAATPAFAQQQPSAPAADAPSRSFTGSDLFGLSIATDPQISPDGRTIAYVRRSGDIMTDRQQRVDLADRRRERASRRRSSPHGSYRRAGRPMARASPMPRPTAGSAAVRALARPATRARAITGLPDEPAGARLVARRHARSPISHARRRRRRSKLGKAPAQARGREMGRAAEGHRPGHLSHRRPRLSEAGLRPCLRRRRRRRRAAPADLRRFDDGGPLSLDAGRPHDRVQREPRPGCGSRGDEFATSSRSMSRPARSRR